MIVGINEKMNIYVRDVNFSDKICYYVKDEILQELGVDFEEFYKKEVAKILVL